MQKEIAGLSEKEVLRRQKSAQGNLPQSITKSRKKIIYDNVCTLFNFLNLLIAVMLFSVKAYSNLVFIGIIVLNVLIGIAQEWKAKKLVDELSILNRPVVSVRREGKNQQVSLEDVVKGDVLVLESGSQICNDSVVIEGGIEVNESLLTGESDAVIKQIGAELFSGSFVISGKAYAKVTHVGNENYATKLANEVKKEKKVSSELLGSMQKITRFTSFLIIPMGILLLLEALFIRHTEVRGAVISSSAALLGMLPKGMVLLISVSLAAGVIRLAKMKILVQNIYSLETLAHVDTLCLDKTGTITDGKLKVYSVIPMSDFPRGEMDRLVRSYLSASDDNNATFQALKSAFPGEDTLRTVHKIPFSSKRKWGCISFEGMGSVFVGAPEKLIGDLPENLEMELEKGRRLITIGYIGSTWTREDSLPNRIQPLYTVVLEDTIRPYTKETLAYFRKEGVNVKVISGDHVKTVSMIAKRAGLQHWKKAVDLSQFGDAIDYDKICQKYDVFARVTPQQKRELVRAMQGKGHQVAMTGDGVNDLLALREADCSIAVADGSDASRQLAQIVLLDSDFTNLPAVVMEGRRVVNNVTRTAGVFFIKTIYSVIVTLFCLISNIPFPFIPIQITLIDAFIEAYPSFLTIIESDTRQIEGSFLKTALSRAFPFGVAVSGVIVAISLLHPFSVEQRETVMYLLLVLLSMIAVIQSCIPFNLLRVFICVTMAVGIVGALVILPNFFFVAKVSFSMGIYLVNVVAVALACILAFQCFEDKRHSAF